MTSHNRPRMSADIAFVERTPINIPYTIAANSGAGLERVAVDG